MKTTKLLYQNWSNLLSIDLILHFYLLQNFKYVGKTQLSHTLCVTTQLAGENGYTGGKVIYIDTGKYFSFHIIF